MIYLIPRPYDYSETVTYDYSEMAEKSAFREDIRNWTQDKLSNIDINTDNKQEAATTLLTTSITFTAIACLPKFIALGCAIVSAVAYVELARMLGAKSGTLKNTIMLQKTIVYLVDPNQNKGQSFTQQIEEIEGELRNLEEASLQNKKLFKEDLFPGKTQSLKDDAKNRKAELESQLKSLQNDLPFFLENSVFLTNLANVWLEIDQNDENKMTACRDFMFYSLAGALLIKIGFLLVSKDHYTRYITHSSLIIALGVLSIAYAAKHVFSMLAHRNDEAKKQRLLATVTQEEVLKLKLLLKPEEMVATS